LSSSAVVNVDVEDLRRLAQRCLPRSVLDYLDSGAEAVTTLAENCAAFRNKAFPHQNGSASNCACDTDIEA